MSAKDEHQMSAVVSRVAQTLTQWEVERSNLKWVAAREAVAKQAGIAPGSLRRLEAGTLKFVDRIGAKLDQLFIRATEWQIASLERELALARARASRECGIDADAVKAALEQARALLKGRSAP